MNKLQFFLVLTFGLLYFWQKVEWKKFRATDPKVAIREFLEGILPAVGVVVCMANSWLIPMLLVIIIEMVYHAWRDKEILNKRNVLFAACMTFFVYGSVSIACYMLVRAAA